MQRNNKRIEGFNLLFIFIILGAMMAMLVGCMVVVKYPEKKCDCKKDTVYINEFKTGASLTTK